MAITEKDVLLVHSPFGPPPGWAEAAEKRFHGLKVRWHSVKLDFETRAFSTLDDLPPEELDGLTLLAALVPPSPKSMANVRFVQLLSAGNDLWLNHEKFLDPAVTFCSGNGISSPAMAEWVMTTWLMHNHLFSMYAAQQREHLWKPRMEITATDCLNRRMGILGYGATGRQIARLAQAFGVEVYAYTRSPRPTPESRKFSGFTIDGTGDVDGVIPTRWFSGSSKEDINNFLGQDLDMLVVLTPLEDSTHSLIGREQFQILGKKKTFLSHLARGPVVNTDALVEALDQGLISGAALDVTDPEPLPKEHPLWDKPNVFITPHMSWQSSATPERFVAKLWKNLEQLDKGEPLFDVIPTPKSSTQAAL